MRCLIDGIAIFRYAVNLIMQIAFMMMILINAKIVGGLKRLKRNSTALRGV